MEEEYVVDTWAVEEDPDEAIKTFPRLGRQMQDNRIQGCRVSCLTLSVLGRWLHGSQAEEDLVESCVQYQK